MNTLDNLLLFLFIAVVLFYCYKKKKFIFSKLRKGETEASESIATAAQNSSNIIPMPVSMGFPQMYPCTVSTGTAAHITHCKIVGVDNNVIDSDADLEHVINAELSKLISAGYAIQNVNAVAFHTGDETDTTHISFCIAYGR